MTHYGRRRRLTPAPANGTPTAGVSGHGGRPQRRRGGSSDSRRPSRRPSLGRPLADDLFVTLFRTTERLLLCHFPLRNPALPPHATRAHFRLFRNHGIRSLKPCPLTPSHPTQLKRSNSFLMKSKRLFFSRKLNDCLFFSFSDIR